MINLLFITDRESRQPDSKSMPRRNREPADTDTAPHGSSKQACPPPAPSADLSSSTTSAQTGRW